MKFWQKQLIKYLIVMGLATITIHVLSIILAIPELNYAIVFGLIFGSFIVYFGVKFTREREEEC